MTMTELRPLDNLVRFGVGVTEAEAEVLYRALRGEAVPPELFVDAMAEATKQAIECRDGFALCAAMGEPQSGVVNNVDAVLKFYRTRILIAEEKANG